MSTVFWKNNTNSCIFSTITSKKPLKPYVKSFFKCNKNKKNSGIL